MIFQTGQTLEGTASIIGCDVAGCDLPAFRSFPNWVPKEQRPDWCMVDDFRLCPLHFEDLEQTKKRHKLIDAEAKRSQ